MPIGRMLVVGALVATVGARLPVGPADALAVLLGASAASVRLADATVDDEPDAAVVGDISLRYVYPEYTGLEARSVPNSDGTIIAPPGTSVTVRARTAAAFQAVAIDVEGLEPVDGTLRGGRDAECELVVDESGRWRFLLFEEVEVGQLGHFKRG